MNRYRSSTGIIINLRNSGDADLFVTLLTAHSGKITALAKGVKTLKSHRLRSLQLGNIIKAQIYQKNDFQWLSEATTTSQFLHTKKNLTQLNLLFYFLEILNQFLAENQHIPGIYAESEAIIKSISGNNLTALIKHEINFMELLGFGVPDSIHTAYHRFDLVDCQKNIKNFLESILEKPLQSSRLFK